MALTPITEGLPADLTSQLVADEIVYYYSYSATVGGCLTKGKKYNEYIALTNKRFIYNTNITNELENNNYLQRRGFIPIQNISFMEVGTISHGFRNSYLHVNTAGESIKIIIPTEKKGGDIRNVFFELTNK